MPLNLGKTELECFPWKRSHGSLMTRVHVQTNVDIILGTRLDPDSVVCPRKTLSL